MKMRPGTQTGFLLCGKEWIDGEALEVRSPWDQGLVGRVTIATRADARDAVNHAVASLRRTRALPRWKRRDILENVAEALIAQKDRFVQLIVAEAGKPLRLARTGSRSRRAHLQNRCRRSGAPGRRKYSAGRDPGQRRTLGSGAALSRRPGARHHAVQLPAEPGSPQSCSRHGCRLPHHPQARPANTLYRACPRRTHRQSRLA